MLVGGGLLVVLLLTGGQSTAAAHHRRCGVTHGLGSYGPGHWPSPCWRPYADNSPFNTPIPARASHAARSGQIVRQLLDGGPIDPLVGGDPAWTAGNPTYYSKRGNPRYRVHCTAPWGRCEIEDRWVHIPSRATPAGGYGGGGDAHLTILDQSTGWEYDLWGATSKHDHTIDVGWGGRTRINGKGLGSGATAAHFGNLAGIIRAQELRAGKIRHALVMVVPCVKRGGTVYPAVGKGGMRCQRIGLPRRSAPRMGAHFQLDITRKRIRDLHIPRWKRAIAEALKRYGAYVADTTGRPGNWGFELEHAATYTSFGHRDEVGALGGHPGVTKTDDDTNGYPEYWFDLSKGVPWRDLRVVQPCRPTGCR